MFFKYSQSQGLLPSFALLGSFPYKMTEKTK